MARHTFPITFEVRVAWWVPLYLYGVIGMPKLTGRDPDEEKILYWVMRGVHLVRCRGPQA